MLNDWFLGSAKNESDYEKAEAYFDALLPDDKQRVKEESWEQIFDIEPFENDWHRKGYFVQATFWELRKEQVISARKFIGRQKSLLEGEQ